MLKTDVDESVRTGEDPREYVRRLAIAKASAGLAAVPAGQRDAAVVLGADTSVVLGRQIFGKPAGEAEAAAMLAALSGRTHQVMSAVALTDGRTTLDRLSVTEVQLRSIRAAESAAYWRTGEPRDKAGGYAIQGLGAVFVEHISGSYSGVVGLPLFETAELLEQFGLAHGLGAA